MNRRNFLKKIGVTCATVIVAPAALVKAKSEDNRVFMIGYKSWIGGTRTYCGFRGRRAGYIITDYNIRHDKVIQDATKRVNNYDFNYPFGKPE